MPKVYIRRKEPGKSWRYRAVAKVGRLPQADPGVKFQVRYRDASGNDLPVSKPSVEATQPSGAASERAKREFRWPGVPIVDISPLLSLPNLERLDLLRTPARADTVSELERKGVKVSIN